MKNTGLMLLAAVLSGCAPASDLTSTPSSRMTAIYSPPVRLGGRGSVMFIPSPSQGITAPFNQDTLRDGMTEADNLESLADRLDGVDRDDPPSARADGGQIKLACLLALRFSEDFKVGRFGRYDSQAADIDTLLRNMRWKALPESGRCDNKHTMNFHSKGFGEYVSAFAESADKKVVAIRGGWQLDPLAGAGEECLYERLPNGRFKLLGCVQSFVS